MEAKHIILPHYFGNSFSGWPLETHLMLQVETDVFHNLPYQLTLSQRDLAISSFEFTSPNTPWEAMRQGVWQEASGDPPPSYLGTLAKSLNSWSWFLCLSHSIHQNNPSLVLRSRKMIDLLGLWINQSRSYFILGFLDKWENKYCFCLNWWNRVFLWLVSDGNLNNRGMDILDEGTQWAEASR